MHPYTIEEIARQREREWRDAATSSAGSSSWPISRKRIIAPLGVALIALGNRLARPRVITAATRHIPSSW